MNTCR